MSGNISEGSWCTVTHDIQVGGLFAFKKDEVVLVEAISPNPERPENKYAVHSDGYGKSFLLSDEDLRAVASPVPAAPPPPPSQSGDEQTDNNKSGLIIAGMVLGIVGGIIGLFSAVFVLFIGGLGKAFEAESASLITGLGWMALFSSILGTVGAALAKYKAAISGILCLVAGVSGFIFVSMGYIVAGPLLIIAGILLLVAQAQPHAQSPSPPAKQRERPPMKPGGAPLPPRVPTARPARQKNQTVLVIVGIIFGILVIGVFVGIYIQNTEKETNEKNGNAVGEYAPPANTPTISKAEFDQIKNGMTYEQVVAIIGGPGELMSEVGSSGSEYYTVMYMWDGDGGWGANANAMFQGGKLQSKAQFGLK